MPVGTYVCDVVGLRGPDGDDAIALIVEIFHTHLVGQKKGLALEHPWIELRAADVLGDFDRNPEGPFAWWPNNRRRLKPVRCPDCRDWGKKVHSVAAALGMPCDGLARTSELGKATYLCALDNCWSCKQDTPVYWWEGAPFAEETPPAPRPPSVRFRNSKAYGGKYWMNNCAHCGAPLGDNFLYSMAPAPLGQMPQRDIEGARGPSPVDRFIAKIR